MNFATLSKNSNGEYILADHNNEKVKVIALFFLNKKLRSKFLSEFKTFEYLSGESDSKNDHTDFVFTAKYISYDSIEELPHDTLLIRLWDTKKKLSETNPLEIEISSNMLKNIIKEIEERIKDGYSEITLSIDKDEYMVLS